MLLTCSLPATFQRFKYSTELCARWVGNKIYSSAPSYQHRSNKRVIPLAEHREIKQWMQTHAHLSARQTRCGCPDAPAAFLPASHLDSPWERLRSIIWTKKLVITMVDGENILLYKYRKKTEQPLSIEHKKYPWQELSPVITYLLILHFYTFSCWCKFWSKQVDIFRKKKPVWWQKKAIQAIRQISQVNVVSESLQYDLIKQIYISWYICGNIDASLPPTVRVILAHTSEEP